MPDPGPIPVVSRMLVSDGMVYATALDDADEHEYLYALDAGTGKLLWRYRSRLQTLTPLLVTVTDGAVYLDYDQFGDDRYGITALSARTGKVLWTRATSHFYFSPAVETNGVIYALGDLKADDGEGSALYALRASDGALLWTCQDWPYHYPLTLPTVVGNTAYVFGSSILNATQPQVDVSTLYALNARDGTLAWYRRWPLIKYAGGSVAFAVANGVIYTTPQHDHEGAGDVYAVRASDGAVLWHTHVAGLMLDAPVVFDGTVYIRSGCCGFYTADHPAIYALDARTGTLRVLFRSANPPDIQAATSGELYVKGQDFNDPDRYAFYALDASSGAIRWYYDPGRKSSAWGLSITWGPINGVVYAKVGESSGENALYALDAATGRALWRAGVDETSFDLTAADGRVYFGSGSYGIGPCAPPSGVGYVYALDAGTGAVLWRYQTGAQAG